MSQPYNPLDKLHLGESIRDALLRRNVHPLGIVERFSGAGIYALYYAGNFSAYEALSAANREGQFRHPIYVGKAVPEGARKGGILDTAKDTFALYKRLKEHAASIAEVKNLDVQDFYCRYLVVDDIWIPLGEALMITKFAPVWNNKLDGFGIHDPGRRRPQQTSAWDTLHPGRAFVEKNKQPPNRMSESALHAAVRDYLAATIAGSSS